MTSPVKSTCFPADNQTLFLGCSVMSFSMSAGLNGQVSELTVQLVEDDCPAESGNPKKFRDCLLREQDWTDPDPGFFGEHASIIGTPAYFRVGDFEYSGLIQGWERTRDQNQNPTYEVKLIDPRILLENTRIIMNDDTGIEPAILDNVYNALYWNEAQRPGAGAVCTPKTQFFVDGVIAGSLAGYYGAADHNRNGLVWDDIAWMIASRINSTDRTDYIRYLSSGGSVTIPVVGTIGGMGLLDENIGFGGYAVDISEIPVAGNGPGQISALTYYRFDQTEASLMEILNQVIQDLGYDYYVELVPAPFNETGSCAGYAGNSNKYDLVIKIRCIDRQTQVAATGSIETFANASANEGRIISYNEGRELRNDITKTMILGGPKQSIWQADNGISPGSIAPYFGLNPDTGDVIDPVFVGGYWQATIPTNDLAFQLSAARYGKAIPANLLVTEQELIMAQGGFDVWHSWASHAGQSALFAALAVDTLGVFDLEALNKLLNFVVANPNNDPRVADFINASKRGFQGHGNKQLEIINSAFGWINKIATEYYGKKFQVFAPWVCTKISLEAQAFINSEEPTDGGWTEESFIVGLPNPSASADFFRLPDERFGPFVGYNVGAVEISNLSQDSYITDGVRVWIKVTQDKDYVFGDKNSQSSPRVVISLPQAIRQAENNISAQVAFNALMVLAGGVDPKNPPPDLQTKYNNILKMVGSVGGHEGVLNPALVPDGAAVAIKSNLLRYGPWSAVGLGTVGGDTNISVEEGLVPWEYAGYSLMNTAGTELSTAGITKQQVIDKGSVTVHGYPDLPLGAEILAIENGTLTGSQLFENRTPTNRVVVPIRTDGTNSVVNAVDLLTGADRWTGDDGANITTITTRVGPQGTQTTYSMRVFTDKFGRFAKLNAKRLKTIGKWRLSLTRYFRVYNRYRLGLLRQQIVDTLIRPAMIINSRWGAGSRTPHEVIVGQLGIWNNDIFQRPMIAQMPIHEASVEVSEDYNKKAFMSIDGLIRPVSVKGANGELPQFINPISGCQMTASKGAQPPIDKPGQAGSFNQYNLNISTLYLNPWSNPSTEVSNRSDTPNHGHDIELIGRGTGVPTGSMMMAAGGFLENGDLTQNDYSSDDDYRAFALKGPLLLQSWGYDLDGFPIPNAIDSDMAAKGGDFESENLLHKFMDNFLRKTETWPVAPVDLRLDRERGVWTVPQFRDIVIEMKEDMSEGSGLAKRISGPTIYDDTGSQITDAELYVNDKLGCSPLKSGEKAIVRFDPEACEYYVIETCPSGGSGNPICSIDVDCCMPDSKRALDICISGESGVGIRKFAFAQGLRAYTGATGECESAGTGITGDCCDLAPDVYLMAGISISGWNNTQGSTCKPGNEVDLPFVNQLLMGDGLKWGTATEGEDATGCSGVLTAGIEIGIATNLCITGQSEPTGFTNKIYLGGGLKGRPYTESIFNKCDYVLAAGMGLYNEQGCVTGAENVENVNKFNFVDGIRVGRTRRDYNNDYNPDFAGQGELECEADIGAGLKFTKDNSEITSPTLSSAGFVNKIIFGSGLTMYSGSDDCEIIVTSATGINSSLSVLGSDTCVNSDSIFPIVGTANSLDFAKGLHYNKVSSTQARIGAGFEFVKDDNASTANPATSVDYINRIIFSSGLEMYSGANDCELIVTASGAGSGVKTTGSDVCVSVDDTNQISAQLIEFAGGLHLDQDGTTSKVGAGFRFLNIEDACIDKTLELDLGGAKYINNIQLADGLWGTTGADPCLITIGAGFEVTNPKTICISNENTNTPDPNFINKFILQKGLFASGNTNCEVHIGAGMDFFNSAGCVTDAVDVTAANSFYIKDGLRATTGDATCKVNLGAGFQFTDNDSASLATPLASTPFANKVILGSGLSMYSGADCEVIIAADASNLYISGEPDDCVDTDNFFPMPSAKAIRVSKGLHFDAIDATTARIGAGFTINNSPSTCVTGSSDTDFANEFNLGRGLKGSTGSSACIIDIGAGVDFSNANAGTGTCIGDLPTLSIDLSDHTLVSKIDFNRGLVAKPGADDCSLIMSAGLQFTNSPGICIKGGKDTGFANQIVAAAGLRASGDTDQCRTTIGAGMKLQQSAGCITSTTSPLNYVNDFIFKDGIRISGNADDCTAHIGAGFQFTSNNNAPGGTPSASVSFANKITFGSGITMYTGADCAITIVASGAPGEGVNVSGTSDCITGADTIDSFSASSIEFGKGLHLIQNVNTARVGAGMTFENIDTCYVTGNITDVVKYGTPIKYKNHFNLGKGLFATTGTFLSDDCEVRLGAGIDFTTANTSTGECIGDLSSIDLTDHKFVNKINLLQGLAARTGDRCTIELGAGFEAQNGDGCVTEKDVKFASRFIFRDGVRVSGEPNQCIASVGAGFNYSDAGTASGNSIGTVAFANKIKIGSGLAVGPTDNECEVIIWATGGGSGSISGCSNNFCVDANDTDCVVFDKITFGKGIRMDSTNAPAITIGAGVDFSILDSCVTTRQAANNINTIQLGSGLSSASLGTCGIQVGAGFVFENVGEEQPTPAYIPFANQIKLGKGLAVGDGGSCAAVIYATGAAGEISGCSNNTCYTTDDAGCTGVTQINFGKGINKTDISDGIIGVSAGLSVGSPNTDCITNDAVSFFNVINPGKGIRMGSAGTCAANISAGINIVNDTSKLCVTSATESAFSNTIKLGRGLSSENLGSCETAIVAGPTISGSDFCKPSTPLNNGQTVELSNIFGIGSGLKVGSDTECQTDWAAGMYFKTKKDDPCPISWAKVDAIDFANNITLIGEDDGSQIGWGLTGTTGVDCEVIIAQGNQLNSTPLKCVQTQENRRWVNKINIGRGLKVGEAQGDADCEATINLNLDIDGSKGSKIKLMGQCAPSVEEEAEGDCTNLLLTFGDSGSLTVVTNVEFTACTIDVTKVPITFCGTVGSASTTSIANLTDCSGEGGCPCPS